MIAMLLLVQIAFLVSTISFLSEQYVFVYMGLLLLNAVLVVYITNTSDNPSYKLPWLIAMLVLPVWSGLAYLLIKTDFGSRTFKKKYAEKEKATKCCLPQDAYVTAQLSEFDAAYANLSHYLTESAGYPVYRSREVQYFSDGLTMFEAVKTELRNARRYIFMEYFIISQGSMWEEILEILKEKAASGLDVRIFYDGFGTQLQMPADYFSSLSEYGIHCRVFNRFKPLLTSSQNNRDHRKILAIDGHTAFTGGINLADEYINRRERFGYWKDGGILCKGEAAWSFTVMFLQLWDLEVPGHEGMTAYRCTSEHPGNYDGFVQPFSDSPTDEEYVGRNVYLDIIHTAKKYVYIMTPYLIPDHEIITALGLAAKKGVDVRLITPHIPDKWYAYETAWSYYPELIRSGVAILEYEPGFIHAKNFLADDAIGVVGTINLDYRSLYLHYECATVLYGGSALKEMRQDFETTFSVTIPITEADCANRPIWKRMLGWLLRIFAPLL